MAIVARHPLQLFKHTLGTSILFVNNLYIFVIFLMVISYLSTLASGISLVVDRQQCVIFRQKTSRTSIGWAGSS